MTTMNLPTARRGRKRRGGEGGREEEEEGREEVEEGREEVLGRGSTSGANWHIYFGPSQEHQIFLQQCTSLEQPGVETSILSNLLLQ